ncbi:MAG: COP23 domain-containing protein [Cyanobacteria bacterium P01_A01_bin.83]
MKTTYLSALLAAMGAMTIATSTSANPSEQPQLNFSCQLNEGVPTTVAQSPESDTQLPVFHWKKEALASKSTDSPEQLCNIVSEKLENYSSQGYDLSSINFVGTVLQDEFPVICANADENGDCSKILLTLKPVTEVDPAIVANDVVDSILDKNLQPQKSQSRDRGVQSISYQVDFWSLLGLRPKFMSK